MEGGENVETAGRSNKSKKSLKSKAALSSKSKTTKRLWGRGKARGRGGRVALPRGPIDDDHKGPVVDLSQDLVLKGRFRLLRKMGSGTFGEVYLGMDESSGTEVAVKTERAEARPCLRMDQEVLEAAAKSKDASRRAHLPKLFGAGSESSFRYLVMERLGASLSELRKAAPGQRLDEWTSVTLMMQALQATEDLHVLGFVHRDLKPTNLLLGMPPAGEKLFVIDFGLSGHWPTKALGNRRSRGGLTSVGFRGTYKYASVGAHRGEELGPRDDLWNLWYSLLELLRGELPWKRTPKPHIAALKEEMILRPGQLLPPSESLQPEPLLRFHGQLVELGPQTAPDYTLLRRLLHQSLTDPNPRPLNLPKL